MCCRNGLAPTSRPLTLTAKADVLYGLHWSGSLKWGGSASAFGLKSLLPLSPGHGWKQWLTWLAAQLRNGAIYGRVLTDQKRLYVPLTSENHVCSEQMECSKDHLAPWLVARDLLWEESLLSLATHLLTIYLWLLLRGIPYWAFPAALTCLNTHR